MVLRLYGIHHRKISYPLHLFISVYNGCLPRYFCARYRDVQRGDAENLFKSRQKLKLINMKKIIFPVLTTMALLYCANNKTFAQTDWHIKGNSGTSATTNF